LLGEKLSARQAADWGLIWRAVPDPEFPDAVDQMARQFAAAPTLGLARIKQALHASEGNDLARQLELERDVQRELGRSEDYREGVAAFMAKRPPQFRGR
jgi:2-(1,2-epoxy-1,2-dihydrophenyl)acetyl-CoA isomerase